MAIFNQPVCIVIASLKFVDLEVFVNVVHGAPVINSLVVSQKIINFALKIH